ncbi:MAG: hypothetical protein ACC700_16975 [Anaerolineales bacterium]
MTGWGILENLVADLLFILLAIAVGWGWLVLTRRTKLQRFFGASDSKRLVIYLSNLRVLPFGSAGISGQRMSYQGSAVPYGELQGANKIRDLHSFLVPSIAEPGGALRRFLFVDISVQILLSPVDPDELEAQAPFIALGSGAYNTASSYIEAIDPESAKFRFGTMTVKKVEQEQVVIRPVASSTDAGVYVVPSGTVWFPPGSEQAHKPRESDEEEDVPSAIQVGNVPDIVDPTYGFVERVREPNADRMVFYVAGLSEFATTGAAYFLASEWGSLDRRYSEGQSFLVMLRFQAPDFTKWTIVFERLLEA